jgi:hypothetical protein
MDFNLDLGFYTVLVEYPIDGHPIPDTIIEDYSQEYYRICWKPNNAGIVPMEPRLVSKQQLSQEYPQIIDAWEAKQGNEKEQASRMEGKFVAFARRFLDCRPDGQSMAQLQREVACDQSLLPGMHQHWGELHDCEFHPQGQSRVVVCKGCRVSHYAQESDTFDRQLIMARGARVAVCQGCASDAIQGVGYRGCVCDSRWTCFRCRESELRNLAKARKEHTEGRCGRCLEAGNLVQHVDFCLYCRQWRVYMLAGQD